MKKLSPVLALSLASLSACGGGSGATGPDAAPSGGAVTAWAGTARRTMVTDAGPLLSETTWEITGLTWVRDGAANPPGQTSFRIGSGRVKESIRQVTGPCTAFGDAEYALAPEDGRLVVTAGSYSGVIQRRTDDPITVVANCGFGSGVADLTDRLEMPIDGAADTARAADRLRGTTSITVAATTNTATWDFTATARER
ncbi:MAG: hypothetical protein ABW221_01625 [Vicinamibacteria bacterium]